MGHILLHSPPAACASALNPKPFTCPHRAVSQSQLPPLGYRLESSPVVADIHALVQHHEGRIGEVVVVGAPGGVNYRNADADLRGGEKYKWRVSGDSTVIGIHNQHQCAEGAESSSSASGRVAPL